MLWLELSMERFCEGINIKYKAIDLISGILISKLFKEDYSE